MEVVMFDKFRALGISTKIMIVVLSLVTVVVAGNYTVFMRGYSNDAREALIEKAAAFTAVADEAKNHVSRLQEAGAIDTEKLLAQAKKTLDAGQSYEDTDFYQTIPVVAGWTAAAEAAKREGIDFHVTAFEARNPDNEPAPGSFEEQLLRDLEAQEQEGGDAYLGRINEETNSLLYLRLIKLDNSCMVCHGHPSTSPNGDGTDLLGFKMENWKPGDTHGAFAVSLPLDTVDAQVAGFFQKGLMVTVPLVVIAGIGFIWMLRTMLAQPIGMLASHFNELATGDLTQRVEIRRKDEFGALGKSFNTFVGKIHGIISDVTSSTQQVASASTEIAASAEQMAAGIANQQEQTTQVSAAIEEMSATVGEVSAKSKDAAQAAQKSGSEATEGGMVVTETVDEMSGISEQVNIAATAVSELGRKGEQIGEIISVINDIADQTNLLALNAAIEAARAGEHGRGFAVVADEVRKLAERTTDATEEVGRSIREIQDETGTAVTQIQASTERVMKGVDLASSAGEALSRIVDGSQNVQGMVQSIAAASEQQSTASTQIARNIEQIDSITRESLQGAQQSAMAAAQLSTQAEGLQRIVNQFKV
jgi:methyl-accepting chemotaxis protein